MNKAPLKKSLSYQKRVKSSNGAIPDGNDQNNNAHRRLVSNNMKNSLI